jgi:hypothetical protein
VWVCGCGCVGLSLVCVHAMRVQAQEEAVKGDLEERRAALLESVSIWVMTKTIWKTPLLRKLCLVYFLHLFCVWGIFNTGAFFLKHRFGEYSDQLNAQVSMGSTIMGIFYLTACAVLLKKGWLSALGMCKFSVKGAPACAVCVVCRLLHACMNPSHPFTHTHTHTHTPTACAQVVLMCLNLAVYIWIPSADYWYVLCLVGGGGFLMVPGGNSIMSDVLPVEVQGLGQVRACECVCMCVGVCVCTCCLLTHCTSLSTAQGVLAAISAIANGIGPIVMSSMLVYFTSPGRSCACVCVCVIQSSGFIAFVMHVTISTPRRDLPLRLRADAVRAAPAARVRADLAVFVPAQRCNQEHPHTGIYFARVGVWVCGCVGGLVDVVVIMCVCMHLSSPRTKATARPWSPTRSTTSRACAGPVCWGATGRTCVRVCMCFCDGVGC